MREFNDVENVVLNRGMSDETRAMNAWLSLRAMLLRLEDRLERLETDLSLILGSLADKP